MASTTAEILRRLAAPFDPEDVQWRIGNRNENKSQGLALCYIDARSVMKRLDEVVGLSGWKDEYEIITSRQSRQESVWKKGDDGKSRKVPGERWVRESPVFLCRLSIVFDGEGGPREWVTKSDVAEATDFEAAKGGCSDAFKRAGVKWGIFRYGYEIKSPWVKLVNNGTAIADGEFKRLAAILGKKEAVAERAAADAPAQDKPAGLSQAERDQLKTAAVSAQQAFGRSQAELDNMLPAERYAPIEYAMQHIGATSLGECKSEHMPALLEIIGQWHELQEKGE